MTIWGTEYGADSLSNIRLSRSVDGKGFYGVVTNEFSCDIYTDTIFNEGSEVVFNTGGLPKFYISKQSHSKGVSHIVCYDRCKNTDILFDYSGYEQFDEHGHARWYPTSTVLQNLTSQCGFHPTGNSLPQITQLCYLDMKGKTCRQILEDLSKPNVGKWICSADNTLQFSAFNADAEGFDISEDDRAEIVLDGKKTISGAVITDEIYNKVYTNGAAWDHSERISGRYLSESVAGYMVGKIVGSGGSYEYCGWNCSAALVGMVYSIGDCIAYDGHALPILSASFDFTALGIVAQMSAPAADTSFAEYQDLYQRKIEGCVDYDRVLGDTKVTREGLRFVHVNETARSGSTVEEYGFKTDTGGMTTYDGVMMDGVMPTEIESVSDTEKKIKYGGKTYRLTFDKNDTEFTNISFTEVET